MPVLGKTSRYHRSRLCDDLIDVIDVTIRYVDFSLIDSARNKATQTAYLACDPPKTKAPFGYSPHNWNCSCCAKKKVISVQAFDFVPYPLPPWNSQYPEDVKETERRFIEVITVFMAVADALGVPLTSGKDFLSLADMPHIEKKNWLFDKHSTVL